MGNSSFSSTVAKNQSTIKYGSTTITSTSNGDSSSSSSNSGFKTKWSSLVMLICALLIVVTEVSFWYRLDSQFHGVSSTGMKVDEDFDVLDRVDDGSDGNGDDVMESCDGVLEREDFVEYFRDFVKDPVLVSGGDQEWKSCAVGCKFGYNLNKKPDAAFGHPQPPGTASVLRSMESSHYYSENSVAKARRRGVNVIMTTSLSSDVPVGYFSWAEYDIMAPVQPKTENALAAAFISNCGARNFRLQALEALEKANIKIDSYGGCHRNHDGRVDKLETLKRYKFSLAFENSNEEDYVTEKYFQSLVAGSIPVVIGAPNIQDFSPYPGSILHIKELEDVESVAKTMKYLADNPEAYNQSLRWKYEGPSDSFKALVDMAAVHSSCRLCIHLASLIREKEEKSPQFKKRPCKCTRGAETVYHIYVRERGRFEMESIFLRSGNMTLAAMESAILMKFKSLNHTPIWKQERPESLRGDNELKIYKIYPSTLTQRQALYTFKFDHDTDLQSHLDQNPCAKFEVIFV